MSPTDAGGLVVATEEAYVLVITTATENLAPDQLAAYPLSGRLFTIRPGVRGIPPHLWAGRATGTPRKGTP